MVRINAAGDALEDAAVAAECMSDRDAAMAPCSSDGLGRACS